MTANRQYDIVIYGASGFTGRLVAEYMAAVQGPAANWAMAGRSLEKLAAVRDEVGAPLETPLVAADAGDLDSFTRNGQEHCVHHYDSWSLSVLWF